MSYRTLIEAKRLAADKPSVLSTLGEIREQERKGDDTMTYVIERVRTHNGQPKEREFRRKGHRVEVGSIALGIPLILRYIDDGNAVLQTSRIEAYNSDWEKGQLLTVQTRNTVYTLRKEDASL